MNAFYMLKDLRDNVGEATESHWGDDDLLWKLNLAHRVRANELISVPGDWLLTSSNLTPVDSVITLPSDCVKPVYMEETTDGYPIPFCGDIRDRRTDRVYATNPWSGSAEAYLVGNTIEVNASSYTTGVTLWYQKRVPDLHAGTESSVAASTLGFDLGNRPRFEDDYYNNVYVEVMDATTHAIEIRSLITDYTAAGVATITGTPTDTDVYGTVSTLPEEAMDLVVLDATLRALAKPSAALDPKYFEYFRELYRDAKRDWNNFISTRISGTNRVRVTETE
jgi:hypothetical protein